MPPVLGEAEAVRILDLMVHSLYSNKEIFLRELISNSSDVIGRLRLELLSRAEIPEVDGPLQIRIGYDKDAGTITIADNGVGMSRDEVIANIGTIAKSGTREFLRSLTGDQRQDAAMIGQFGVGFYSSFTAAERVLLTTRRAGMEPGDGVRWESDGRGQYALDPRTARAGHHDRASPARRRGRPAERLAAEVDHVRSCRVAGRWTTSASTEETERDPERPRTLRQVLPAPVSKDP